VPSIGVIAVSLAIVTLIYVPLGGSSLPSHWPRATVTLSVLTLAFVCTGLAFLVFFRLIREIGPARAGLITFANPVIAVALGAVFLDEPITVATLIGFVLVLTGCALATRPAPASEAGVGAPALADATTPG
jgi:drug/metabolite transporter (DMT)-like permease